MRDVIEIGPVPCDEECEQVGMPTYDGARARLECQCYIEQLRRQFGPEPEGARLRIKSSPHDFGNYLEVVCNFDNEYPESVEYAFKCEGGDVWAYWDNESRDKLGLSQLSADEINRLDFERLGDKLSNELEF